MGRLRYNRFKKFWQPVGEVWDVNIDRNPWRNNYIRNFIHGNGVLVAVGDYAAIATSTDLGETWEVHTDVAYTPLVNSYYPIGAWSGILFGVLGSSGQFLTSPNGEDWTYSNGLIKASQGINTGSWNNLTSSGGKFVAVSANGFVSTSTGGDNWSTPTRKIPQNILTKTLTEGPEGTLIVCLTGAGAYAMSKDAGETWTIHTIGLEWGSGNITRIGYANENYFAVGSSNRILMSPTGEPGSWVSQPITSASTTYNQVIQIDDVVVIPSSTNVVKVYANGTWSETTASYNFASGAARAVGGYLFASNSGMYTRTTLDMGTLGFSSFASRTIPETLNHSDLNATMIDTKDGAIYMVPNTGSQVYWYSQDGKSVTKSPIIRQGGSATLYPIAFRQEDQAYIIDRDGYTYTGTLPNLTASSNLRNTSWGTGFKNSAFIEKASDRFITINAQGSKTLAISPDFVNWEIKPEYADIFTGFGSESVVSTFWHEQTRTLYLVSYNNIVEAKFTASWELVSVGHTARTDIAQASMTFRGIAANDTTVVVTGSTSTGFCTKPVVGGMWEVRSGLDLTTSPPTNGVLVIDNFFTIIQYGRATRSRDGETWEMKTAFGGTLFHNANISKAVYKDGVIACVASDGNIAISKEDF